MPIDYKKSADVLNRINWRDDNLYKNVDLANEVLPYNVRKVIDDKKPYLYFNNFNSLKPNTNKAIEKWEEDVFFELNDSHWPNSANMMKGQISWSRTIILILSIVLLLYIAKRKWSKTYA